MDKPIAFAPGRLGQLVSQGLRGHHPLFDEASIRSAFAEEDRPVSREDAGEVGAALLALCRDPAHVARGAVATLSSRARLSLIRLYFRLLDRAQEERTVRH